MAWSRAVSTAAGATIRWALSRSTFRACAMTAAASWSWPETSPTTSSVLPSETWEASYRSPPTCTARRRH
jgi:hypothetical protein